MGLVATRLPSGGLINQGLFVRDPLAETLT
jgi:hypothetical protein